MTTTDHTKTSGVQELPACGDVAMVIGGEFVGAVGGQWTDVVSPGSLTVIGRVPSGSAEDVDRAVAAARSALPGWRGLPFTERQRILLAIADALFAEAEELSLLTAADTGNALRTQARPESQTLATLFRYFGGIAGELKGVVLPAGEGQLQYSVREPVGVVGAILPWNSPLMIAGMKIPAALAECRTAWPAPGRRSRSDRRGRLVDPFTGPPFRRPAVRVHPRPGR
jgi:aldehyde dehydrogenase (NAD+)